MNRAFSLVELSIVLVILGLLTGGILSGQSLIRAAELRSVSADYQRYAAAISSFRDKYFALPGDMPNATSFWGTTTATGTVNGNGNGVMEGAAAINASGETEQAWRQMALAGLIEGSYTGLAGSNNTQWIGQDSIPNNNVPGSKISTGGWAIGNNANYAGSGTNYQYDFANFISFGAINPGSIPDAALLKPEEAWNIDTKLDDGLPGSGKLFARDVVGFGNAGACTTSTSATDKPGAYNLSSSTIACAYKFARAL